MGRTYAGAGKKCEKTGGIIMADHNPHSSPSPYHTAWVGEGDTVMNEGVNLSLV